MKDLTIRQASESDIEMIRDIAKIAFPETYEEILTKEQIDYMMDWMYSPESIRSQMIDGHIYYLAGIGDEAVGYVSIQKESDNAAKKADKTVLEPLYHLHKIYVLPNYQGYGIGKALFMKAVEHIKHTCSTSCRMELNVNRNNKALGFYRRLGMTIARQGDFPIGNGYYMNDYILTLPIN